MLDRPLIAFIQKSDFDAELASYTCRVNGFDPELIICRNGLEAVEKVASARRNAPVPDLIILDLDVTMINGLDLLRTLRQRPHTMHIPIFVLASAHDKNLAARAIELGATEVLPKPWRYNAFAQACNRQNLTWTQCEKAA